mmetsp:Transcript_18589/g.74213  ORF Transcript_18589/g.74213 Transcript_18589/m.74213 type:complete len:92 (-) Transcript_18589:646-921(-)
MAIEQSVPTMKYELAPDQGYLWTRHDAAPGSPEEPDDEAAPRKLRARASVSAHTTSTTLPRADACLDDGTRGEGEEEEARREVVRDVEDVV